jgi:Spy/CpxP family protein refolding chaperone
MQRKRLIAVLATTLALGAFGTAARAETNDDMSFSGMFKLDRIDRNKDKMVSKAEFLEMMGKIYDMKTKEMKVKGDKITAAELQQIMMYFRAGS